MKIAINCAFLQPRGGGIKEYIVNLVTNLAAIEPENEYVIYVLRDFRGYAEEVFKGLNVRIKDVPFGTGSSVKKIFRSLTESFFWRKEEAREKWDLFHSPFFHCPTLKCTPTVITVHDLRFVRYPETYSFLRVQFLKRAVKRSLVRADRLISISDFTKSEIMDAYGLPEDKITVIHEAIDCKKFSECESASESPEALKGCRFILTVGHLEPRKNYDNLIKAFDRLKNSRKDIEDVKLVIVGQKGCYYDSTLKLVEETKDVVYMNFVSHELLIWLYRNASLFVFPSIYEGFGFPPLEAASLGVVSAVSNVSSIPEVCGDAVVYFNPYEVDDIEKAMAEGLLNEELRESLRNKLPGQLAKFSWRKNAEDTLKIYRAITQI